MSQPIVISGVYADRTFLPTDPLPDTEGTAQLVITPRVPGHQGSIVDAFGTAPVLRSGEEILAEIRADRDEWGDR